MRVGFLLCVLLLVVPLLPLEMPVDAGEDAAVAVAEGQVDPESQARAEYEAAERAAREAEAALAPLREAMQKADAAYANARTAANAKRQQATTAKNLAGEPGAKELAQAEADVPAAVQELTAATSAKPALDEVFVAAKAAALPLQQAYEAADKAAREAEAAAQAAADAAGRLDRDAQRAAAQAVAKRRAAEVAQAALLRAGQSEQNLPKQIATATAALAVARQAAEQAAQVAQTQEQAAAQAKARLQAVAAAAAALAQAQAAEQQAQAQWDAATRLPSEAQEQQRVAEQALTDARQRTAAAHAAQQAAQEAAQDLLQLEAAREQTAAVAAAKRKIANDAKAAWDPQARSLEQALLKANAAAQALERAQQRKRAAEDALADLKKRIAAAKLSHEADEQAAQEAEAAAVPLKAQAEAARQAYLAAKGAADQRLAQVQEAKAALYRLVASRQVIGIMESPAPPEPANGIDDIVFARLQALGIQPALCSDAVFVRRAYLDLTGTLPAVEEAKAFIQDPDVKKRVALIDRLLEHPAHFNYWTMKWSDILRVKAEFPVKVWPNAAQAYHRWLWDAVARNKPYDQFARELLTSSGSNYRVGPVNFYRAIQDRTPEGIAAAVGLALMGTRVPFWPPEQQADMAAFFTQIGYKPTSEWKEEIVFWDPLHSTEVPGSIAPGIDAVAASVIATNQIPQGLATPLEEQGPLAVVFPDGASATIPPDRDPRTVFADWLIRPENPWFAKAIVNRTWAWAMGRGIIHEPDDIRDDNPPSNPELLAYLQQQLVASGFDLKQLKRLIFTSTTYQFSSVPKSQDPEAIANFASYALRRVEAEVLIDALNQITGSSDLYTSAVPEPFTYIPDNMSAVELADGSITSSFLTLFGRSARATGMESERINELASPQWLHMLNSATIQAKLQSGPKLAAMVSTRAKPEEIAEQLYLTILSRLPTEADLKAAEEHARTGVAKGKDVWIDLAWALINSPEFLLRH